MSTTPLILFAFAPHNLRKVKVESGNLSEIVPQQSLIEGKFVNELSAKSLNEAVSSVGQRLLMFHYSGHSSPNDLLMHDGKSLGSTALSRILKHGQENLSFVFLNGCESYGHITALAAKGVKAFIVSNTSIGDTIAVNLATEFYNLFLLKGYTLKSAFEAAAAAATATVTRDAIVPNIVEVNTGEVQKTALSSAQWVLAIHTNHNEVKNWTLADFVKDKKSPSELRGELLYHIPTQMQVGVISECIVRIAVNREIIKVGIEITTDTKTENIIISEVMRVTLSESKLEGQHFEIEEDSKQRQKIHLKSIDSYTEWLFNVKPLNRGSHRLTVKVYTVDIIEGKEEEEQQLTFRKMVYVRTYAVKKQAPVFRKFLSFVINSFHQGALLPEVIVTLPEKVVTLSEHPMIIWRNLSMEDKSLFRHLILFHNSKHSSSGGGWFDIDNYSYIISTSNKLIYFGLFFFQKNFVEAFKITNSDNKIQILIIILFIFHTARLQKNKRWEHEWIWGNERSWKDEWRWESEWRWKDDESQSVLKKNIAIDALVLFIIFTLGSDITSQNIYNNCSQHNYTVEDIELSLERLSDFRLINNINHQIMIKEQAYLGIND